MNTITIFDGAQTTLLVYKGTFEISSGFVLRRDLLQLKTSEVIVYDKENTIKPQDIVLFSYQGKMRFGKVYATENNYGVSKITFTYGIDVHQTEIPLFYAWVDFQDFECTNRQPLKLFMYDDRETPLKKLSVLAPDKIMKADTILRQFARRDHYSEIYYGLRSLPDTHTYDFFRLDFSDYCISAANTPPVRPPYEVIQIRLDDPDILSTYVLRIGQDKMTRLRLQDPDAEDSISSHADYQMLKDGTVVNDTADPLLYLSYWSREFTDNSYLAPDALLPQRFVIQEPRPEQGFDLEYATDIFRQNEYDNEIEIELPEINNYFKLNLDYDRFYESGTLEDIFTVDTLLGQKVQIYLPGSGVSVDSFVSGYEISNGVMKVIFGLARTRLTDVINNYLNKDNL